MAEIDKDEEFEQSERNSLFGEEFSISGTNEERKDGQRKDNLRKDDLEVIDIIGSLMQDEDFSLEGENSSTVNKILSFLNREIDQNRNFTEALLIKGTVLYKTGRYNSAIEAFDQALETIPEEISEENLSLWTKHDTINYKYALKFKALALFKLGRYKEGLDALNEILAAYPEDLEIHEYRNIISILQDESLITELNKLPYIYPEISGEQEHNFGLVDPDRYARAIEVLDKSLEINPQDAEIWRYRGSALYVLGRYEDALEAFEKSLEINPKNENVWSFKGSTLYMLNSSEKALKAFDKALQKNPNKFEAWFNKGSVLFELGRYKQALSAVENALRIRPEDTNALNLKISILDKLGQDTSQT